MNQKEKDIQMMLAAGCHLGTKNCDFQMERYVFNRNQEGVNVFNLDKTWNKLQLAARVIVAIEEPKDVMVATARPYAQRAVLKFAQYTGTKYQAGRHTPGTFTNQIQKYYEEPRLLVLCDPRTDHQPIKEASYVNIPTISFCNTDSSVKYVDIAIPANNKGRKAIGVLYFILARMVLQMRGTLRYDTEWDVVVDLFFYREPEETKEEEGEAAGYQPAVPGAEWTTDQPQITQGATYAAAGEGWEEVERAPFAEAAPGQWPGQPEQNWAQAPPPVQDDGWGTAPPPLPAQQPPPTAQQTPPTAQQTPPDQTPGGWSNEPPSGWGAPPPPPKGDDGWES